MNLCLIWNDVVGHLTSSAKHCPQWWWLWFSKRTMNSLLGETSWPWRPHFGEMRWPWRPDKGETRWHFCWQHLSIVLGRFEYWHLSRQNFEEEKHFRWPSPPHCKRRTSSGPQYKQPNSSDLRGDFSDAEDFWVAGILSQTYLGWMGFVKKQNGFATQCSELTMCLHMMFACFFCHVGGFA